MRALILKDSLTFYIHFNHEKEKRFFFSLFLFVLFARYALNIIPIIIMMIIAELLQVVAQRTLGKHK